MSEQISENKKQFIELKDNILNLIKYEKCPIKILKYKDSIIKLDRQLDKKQDITLMYEDTFGRGKVGEDAFKEIALSRDWIYLKTTLLDDIYKHIDAYIVNPITNRKIGVDVKAIKRVGRSSEDNDQIMWIEYKNAWGYDGWIHGKQDGIAQMFDGGFYLIDRKSLVAYANKLKVNAKVFERTEENKHITTPFYQLYKRNGNRAADKNGIIKKSLDLTMLVKMQDIIDNCNVKIWYY